jgi:hypothetical protein
MYISNFQLNVLTYQQISVIQFLEIETCLQNINNFRKINKPSKI